MKKYILTLMIGTLVFLTANFVIAAPFQKEVVIFSQPCYYCDLMKKDLNAKIIPANPDVKFTIIDISNSKKNYNLLIKYLRQYKIEGDSVGMPLIFVGKNHIMGWGEEAPIQIQEYIEELKQEKITRIPAKNN